MSIIFIAQQEIPKLDHSWNLEYTVDKEASCEEAGSKSIHCSKCSTTKDVITIEAIGHSYGEWKVDKESTCAETGSKHKTCANCGNKETETIPLKEHSWNTEYTVDKEASCEETGSKSIHCSKCDATKGEESIEAIGHSYGEWEVDKESSCAETGFKHKICTYCGNKVTETIPVKEHSWNAEYTVDKEPTCEEAGSKSIHCIQCNATKDIIEIEKLEHFYDEGVVTIEPTSQKEGEKTYTCTYCGYTKTEKLPVLEIINPFVDVSQGNWFYNSVKWAYQNGLLTGTDDATFSPNESMTRGMLVTVLYRKAGRPTVDAENKFWDVNSKKYYASAIVWASSLKLVSGYTNGNFGPEDSITREQIAKILYLYAAYEGYDTSNSTDVSSYKDAEKISGYAKKYMQWAVAEGFIKGSNGQLNPKGNATRAEISAILKRFVEKYEIQ